MTTGGEQAEIAQISTFGSPVDEVFVTIGPQFLNRFSEHLYSSPNKAFEELVTNSWDAHASVVYVDIPEDLSDEQAAVWILDDGTAMGVDGFGLLWSIASSHKRDTVGGSGRKPIGKFGIGKLATYVLANELTYISKAADGVIRAITMDYRRIDQNPEAFGKLTIDELPLSVREISQEELQTTLATLQGGENVTRRINDGVPRPPEPDWQDEFGGATSGLAERDNTWTLAVMSSLKPAGAGLSIGWIHWLLRTALPLGAEMSVVLNDEVIVPRKLDVAVTDEWVLGDNLGIESVELPNGTAMTVRERSTPHPHVLIEGVPGEITGRVRLYTEKISGGKSEELASSNGFQVNILGRVINLDDPYFGLTNLNHSSWAKFRATVRADGLDQALSVSREDLKKGEELARFQAFLMALFNKARATHDALTKASWPKVGEVLTDSWSSVPLQPLLTVIREGLQSATGPPPFVDSSGVEDAQVALAEWEELSEDPGRLIEEIVFQPLAVERELAFYDLSGKRIVINSNHPFAREHIGSHEEQLLLRDAALVDILVKARMIDNGVTVGQLEEIEEYREQALRLIAQVRRRTGVQIAHMLLNATDHAKALERIVSDALDYLGFVTEPMGQSGEPEGLATAPTSADASDRPTTYKFTYDAKSSRTGKVATGNVNVAGLVRHRKKHGAAHILVVAPDFQEGALEEECANNGVTPMRAKDLAALLMLSGSLGAIDLNKFKEVFEFTGPDDVHAWVENVEEYLRNQSRLSLTEILRALDEIGFEGPNAVSVSVIADRIGKMPNSTGVPSRKDVREVIHGLAVLVPGLIRITGDDVFLSTAPDKLREAILSQIAAIPEAYRFGMDEKLHEEG